MGQMLNNYDKRSMVSEASNATAFTQVSRGVGKVKSIEGVG